MRRHGRILVSAAVVAALVAPVALDRDGFPLSTYPMYSRTRGDVVTFATAHGVTSAGAVLALTLPVIGESDDPLIVAGELRDCTRDGRAEDRCAEIAERAARWGGLSSGAVAVEVVTEQRDVVAHVRGEASLVDRTVHARCGIVR